MKKLMLIFKAHIVMGAIFLLLAALVCLLDASPDWGEFGLFVSAIYVLFAGCGAILVLIVSLFDF